MTGQTQTQHALVALRIEVTPYSYDQRMVQFTATSDTGAVAPLTVQVSDTTMTQAHDAFAAVAAHSSTAESGFAFGRGDSDRVAFEFTGYTAGRFGLRCTFAYAGAAGYNTVTLTAQVSDASLGRLVDGFGQLQGVEEGSFDWTVAG
ncbi:hypothetical protein IP92_02610 [Pseudoduganella flava]|uniref:DUF3224 domain-containing protein n=1 Tax=Pseudoduganella flava TaxID=871742 RepID=A0A562PTQ2_9BURK|nr:hypothetical protein [Pseudoduganella flava]QGZ39162.1 hypothetical protein GO485_08965 [Pseudoduganella flava]TWI47550.1 hypothetical protein IP92_02610 [Pseudoduganella flava]